MEFYKGYYYYSLYSHSKLVAEENTFKKYLVTFE